MAREIVQLPNGWLSIPFSINGYSDAIAGMPDVINSMSEQEIEAEIQERYNNWVAATTGEEA